jgi:hypothetical protein
MGSSLLHGGASRILNSAEVLLTAVQFFQHLPLPTMTKDGVSVAREIELKDKFENIGAHAGGRFGEDF